MPKEEEYVEKWMGSADSLQSGRYFLFEKLILSIT